MKTAKEIAKKHCLEFTRKEYPNQEFEDHYDAPEWMVDAMKEYAREACKEQREICANQIRTRFDVLENVEKVKTAPDPELS